MRSNSCRVANEAPGHVRAPVPFARAGDPDARSAKGDVLATLECDPVVQCADFADDCDGFGPGSPPHFGRHLTVCIPPLSEGKRGVHGIERGCAPELDLDGGAPRELHTCSLDIAKVGPMTLSLRRPSSGLFIGALVALGCGDGDPNTPAPEEIYTPPIMEMEEEVVPSPEPPVEEIPDPVEMPSQEERCVAPLGVVGSPSTIEEALILMNSLPRPTTLECFIQSLDRPLSVYLTSSSGSLQPSPGARSPRTFIVNGDLVMSIVFDGVAGETLELGYRTSPDRSVKTEILFPLQRDITTAGLFDQVLEGSLTICGRCHTGEIFTSNLAAFPQGAFESAVLVPSPVFTVPLESLRAEEAECDPTLESNRCGMLDAFFDHGEVLPSLLWPEPAAL